MLLIVTNQSQFWVADLKGGNEYRVTFNRIISQYVQVELNK